MGVNWNHWYQGYQVTLWLWHVLLRRWTALSDAVLPNHRLRWCLLLRRLPLPRFRHHLVKMGVKLQGLGFCCRNPCPGPLPYLCLRLARGGGDAQLGDVWGSGPGDRLLPGQFCQLSPPLFYRRVRVSHMIFLFSLPQVPHKLRQMWTLQWRTACLFRLNLLPGGIAAVRRVPKDVPRGGGASLHLLPREHLLRVRDEADTSLGLYWGFGEPIGGLPKWAWQRRANSHRARSLAGPRLDSGTQHRSLGWHQSEAICQGIVSRPPSTRASVMDFQTRNAVGRVFAAY
ncbi:Hypothetical predicted protein [Podarcis lilfordi]|uniref:Uncharacterized protein n=1 Tax=Podarcis lilfordi TaxID=74358 RepID=A0AA35LPA3_9SAUR|nr:Hypothetical predicted protein [Podarcis lilfordi]